MRKHEVKCIIKGGKSDAAIQNKINRFTVYYVEKTIRESGLSKAEQLYVIEELLKELRRYQAEDKLNDNLS